MDGDKTQLRRLQPTAAEWDNFVCQQPRAHLLQLSRWGALKKAFGWDARIMALGDGERILAGAQILLKPLPFRIGTLAYLPMGPYIADESLYSQLWRAIARETGAAFLKLEPGHYPASPPDFAAMGFMPSPQTIQPARSIQIDIGVPEDEILRRMNQGTRRKIRKSQKSGIMVKEGERGDLAAFNRLMRETGDRNAFGVHSPAYFEQVYDLFLPGYGCLLLAEHEGETLAAIMVFALGESAWYFYGASSRSKANLYASYGLQWRAIQWAKARGCKVYDMWGIPDCDEAELEAQFKHRRDGLWGVYGFKRGFGGEIARAAGSWDLAFNPLIYRAYRGALKLRS